MSNTNFLVTSSPHLHAKDSTSSIMRDVIIALIPTSIWGIYVFGSQAAIVIGVSVISAVISEFIMCKLTKRYTLSDYSAVLTGLLVGLNMPSGVDIYVPIVASAVAIILAKWTFGGLGANIVNPALCGRLFVVFSWTNTMSTWSAPITLQGLGADTLASASPLGYVKTSLGTMTGSVSGPSAMFLDYPKSSLATWFNSIGINIDGIYLDLFFGNVAGCIGEVSAFLLLIGAAYLFARKILTWQTPVSYIVSFALFIWIFDGLRFGTGFFTGDIFFHLLSGGLMLGALFMATDMVTSPLIGKGQIVFGIGCGFLTFLIRVYGSYPEGVSLAIIIMNLLVPMIDRLMIPKVFGYIAPEKKK